MSDPKEVILTELYKAAPEPVSGERLAARLGISRPAVWKHIQALREQGYAIRAVPHQGYILTACPDRLLPAEIRRGLKTCRIGSAFYWYEEIASTNLVAMRLAAEEEAPDGTVVVAEHQTAGRGRRGRSWVETPGSSILVSVIVRPSLPVVRAGQLMLLTGMAVARAIRQLTDLPAGVKWPNDILIGGKKVSGTLIELLGEAEQIKVAVLGIGINCNQSLDAFPPELRDHATSLALELGRPVHRVRLLRAVLTHLDTLYDLYLRGDSETILTGWRQLTVTLGRRVIVSLPGELLEGEAEDITDEGLLVVRLDDGTCRLVAAGDVSLRAAEGGTRPGKGKG